MSHIKWYYKLCIIVYIKTFWSFKSLRLMVVCTVIVNSLNLKFHFLISWVNFVFILFCWFSVPSFIFLRLQEMFFVWLRSAGDVLMFASCFSCLCCVFMNIWNVWCSCEHWCLAGSYLPLPEDRDLQGFIPLEKSFSDLR